MALTLEQIDFLYSPEGIDALTRDWPADELTAQRAMRKSMEDSHAQAISAVRSIRRRAPAKFPEPLAAALLATDTLLQQASSYRLARHTAQTLAARFETNEVWDLCCGLGSDAIGLAEAGLAVRGVDASPVAVRCAQHNAQAAGVGDRCSFQVARVEDLLPSLPSDAFVQIDPDRRASGRRVVELADYAPGVETLQTLIAQTRGGSIKLSAALHYSLLTPLQQAGPVAVEYLSESGTCRQLRVWWGVENATRHATVVSGEMTSPVTESLETGLADLAPITPAGTYLMDPDPAVLAAGGLDDLAARFDLTRLHPRVSILTGPHAPATTLGQSYRVLAQCPARLRDVRTMIRSEQGGTIAIKPRGVSLDTDAMQKKLRGPGDRPLSLFWMRVNQKHIAILAERV